MLAAWFRIVFAGVFLVAVGELVGVLRLLGAQPYLAVLDPRQLHALALLRINAFTDIWNAGLILFSLSLFTLGYLTYRSGFMPRILGVLLVVAGLGYLTDSLGSVLVQGYSATVGAFTFPGELLLGLWLLFRARSIAASTSPGAPDHRSHRRPRPHHHRERPSRRPNTPDIGELLSAVPRYPRDPPTSPTGGTACAPSPAPAPSNSTPDRRRSGRC